MTTNLAALAAIAASVLIAMSLWVGEPHYWTKFIISAGLAVVGVAITNKEKAGNNNAHD